MTSLKLGLPSKGRLQTDAMNWFAQYGITITRTGSDREYTGQVDGIDNMELVLLSASEIPRELSAGRIQLGVTGEDLIQEKLAHWANVTPLVAHMGFGFANLVIAVPDSWWDVETVDDLDAVAARFHRRHGFRLRIATKYHNLVRGYLAAHEVADYQIVDSQGATEGTVKNQTAEAIADITSSGATLTANRLKMLSDGPILRSQASLFISARAHWGGSERQSLTTLSERLGYAISIPPNDQG